MTSSNLSFQYGDVTSGNIRAVSGEASAPRTAAATSVSLTEMMGDPCASASVMSAALNYAEKASPGVGARVSACDYMAITQGVLRALSMKGVVPLVELRPGPPSTLLSDITKSVEAIVSSAKAMAETAKGGVQKSLAPLRAPRAAPRQGPAAPKSVSATAAKTVVSAGTGAEDVDKRRSTALSKCLAAAKRATWQDILLDLKIDEEKIRSHIKGLDTKALDNAAKVGLNVPPLVRYQVITPEDIVKSGQRFANDAAVAALVELAKKRFAGGEGQSPFPMPEIFPAGETNFRLAYPIDVSSIQLAKRVDYITEIREGLVEALKLPSLDDIHIEVGALLNKEYNVYRVKLIVEGGPLMGEYPSFMTVIQLNERAARVIFRQAAPLLTDGSEGTGLALPAPVKKPKSVETVVSGSETSATPADSSATKPGTSSTTVETFADKAKNQPKSKLEGPKTASGSQRGANGQSLPAASLKPKASPGNPPKPNSRSKNREYKGKSNR